MTANAPHHLYKNLKFSELSKFSDVCNSPLPHVNYPVREPHVSHTGINVYAYCPLHLPKKVTEKPSVNHIGSSTSHQKKLCVIVYVCVCVRVCMWPINLIKFQAAIVGNMSFTSYCLKYHFEYNGCLGNTECLCINQQYSFSNCTYFYQWTFYS